MKLLFSTTSDSKKKLKDCNTIASRKVKYCSGSRTGDVQNRGTFNLDRKTVEINL